ncbi:hypothetical protein DPMN_091037 [Dreissena polymorpha]|uniref:Uncharacterized protein n=1 Tax=Dreissena polymorpha TaxID=45954 RepID=A0A9D4QZL7_DREPO|nr:hypothetical protein DPMN_091037 [Dreissena polymorpha]
MDCAVSRLMAGAVHIIDLPLHHFLLLLVSVFFKPQSFISMDEHCSPVSSRIPHPRIKIRVNPGRSVDFLESLSVLGLSKTITR